MIIIRMYNTLLTRDFDIQWSTCGEKTKSLPSPGKTQSRKATCKKKTWKGRCSCSGPRSFFFRGVSASLNWSNEKTKHIAFTKFKSHPSAWKSICPLNITRLEPVRLAESLLDTLYLLCWYLCISLCLCLETNNNSTTFIKKI